MDLRAGDYHVYVHRCKKNVVALERAVQWRLDFPKASRENCAECKSERDSIEPCAGCPFNWAPTLTDEQSELIEIFNTVSMPFVMQHNAFEFALAAFKPAMTTLEARRLLLSLNSIHMTFYDHEQKKINQRKEKHAH